MPDEPAPIDVLIAEAIKIYIESVSIETREAFVQKSLADQRAVLADWLATKATPKNRQVNGLIVGQLRRGVRRAPVKRGVHNPR
jgi:hypothetical protein